MTTPQTENGYTKIANEIIEALAKIRISGEEMQCLWVIIRKTYGWNKKKDQISLSQFSEMTGFKRPSVVRALNKLSQKHLIIKNDNDNISTYCFQKDFSKWQPLSKKITFVRESKLKSFCYICGFTDAVERHHIIPQSKQGSNRIENIIILCPNCHTLTHKGKFSQSELFDKKDNIENAVIKNDNALEQKVKMTLSKKIHTKDTLTKDTSLQKKTTVKFPLPEWIEEKAWNGFIEMRKSIKKPMGNHAKELAVKKLEGFKEQGHDPNVILDNSTEASWQGLFIPKSNDNIFNPKKRFAGIDKAGEIIKQRIKEAEDEADRLGQIQ